MKLNPLGLCAAGLIAFAAPQASAAVTVSTLDFNELAGVNNKTLNTYAAAGYELQSSLQDGLGVFSANHPYNADLGHATLSVRQLNGGVTFRRADGGLFDFLSIDLSDYFNSTVSTGAVFTFVDALGATTSSTVFTDNVKGLQTFVFDQKNLRAFTLRNPPSQFVQFDNVVLSSGTANAVPEPATWALMLMGFFGLGSALRGRRHSSPATIRA